MLQFVNPLLLMGAAAASAPIIIHLLNRRRFKVVNWAAMEFLLASSRRNFRRVRLQEIILLVLRTLVLLLVALALARPFMSGAAAVLGGSQRYVVMVIDNSFSMGYSGGSPRPYDEAVAAAGRLLDTLNEGDVVSLVALSDRARPLVREPSLDIETVRREIDQLALSQGSTNLPDALRLARDLLKESKVVQKELHLFTDNQRTAWREGGSGIAGVLREISGLADCTLVDVGRETRENTAITGFSHAERILGKEKPDTAFDVRVENFGEIDRNEIDVSFYVDDFRQGSASVRVPAGGKVDLAFSYTFHDALPHSLAVKLKHDGLEPDDERYLAVDVLESAKVLLVDGRPSADEYASATGYLKTALHPKSTDAFQRSTIYEPVIIQPAELDRTRFSEYEIVVLADVPQVDAAVATELEDYVRSGGALLVFLGDNVDHDACNRTLFQEGRGLLPARLGGVRGDPRKQTFVSPQIKPDSRHPLLSQFRQQRASYLNMLQFYQYDMLEAPDDENVNVVFSFDNGVPALVEKTFGSGTVLLFGFTANDAWTDFPRRPGYLLLMQEVASYVARDRQKGKNLLVGDEFVKTAGPEALASKVSVSTGGREQGVRAVPNGQAARLTFSETDTAGIYTLKIERGGAVQQDFFAVNVDPTESDLHRIGPQELRRAFPDFRFRHVTGTSGTEGSLVDALRRSEMWKHLLIAALVLMCVESVLAQRFGR